MADHPNAALARAMNEAMSRGDFQTAGSYLADDVEWHEIGRAEARHGMAELQAAMFDEGDSTITYRLHDVVGNDDHVVALGEATATRGGKTLVYRTAEIYHFRHGKVAERWAFSDDTQAIVDFFA
jgi:ketosteroid isomerase-like protein